MMLPGGSAVVTSRSVGVALPPTPACRPPGWWDPGGGRKVPEPAVSGADPTRVTASQRQTLGAAAQERTEEFPYLAPPALQRSAVATDGFPGLSPGRLPETPVGKAGGGTLSPFPSRPSCFCAMHHPGSLKGPHCSPHRPLLSLPPAASQATSTTACLCSTPRTSRTPSRQKARRM